MRDLVKRVPLVKGVVRFLKKPFKYLKLIESDNFRFISTFEPGHFYSPIPDYHDFVENNMSLCDRSVTELAGIKLNTQHQIELIDEFSNYYSELPFKEEKTQNTRFWLDNGLFSYGDPVILYSFIRHFKPKRIIEIGSGFSSAAMLDINDKFFNSEIDFDFIEPYPDRLYSLLSDEDKERYRIHVTKIQSAPLDIFPRLTENDILFVDSSHVAKSGSDLVYILSEILPLLNKGVIVHFHDILWPFEYPDEWFVDGRAWNEAYFLKAFLQFNDSFEISYFNSQMRTHYSELLKEKLPAVLKKPSNYPYTQANTSLWLRKIK